MTEQFTTPVDARIHLDIVGAFLEHHETYRTNRKHAIEEIVLSAARAISPKYVTVERVLEVVCVGNTSFLKKTDVRDAVRRLEKDERLVPVSARPGNYALSVSGQKQANHEVDHLRNRLRGAYERHFLGATCSEFAHFEACIALLFAQYGCAAFDSITSKSQERPRLSSVVRSLGLESAGQNEFKSLFEDFIVSTHPDDARVKVDMAATYALLRMVGAGNWSQQGLKDLVDGKRILLDTNVLYELVGSRFVQAESMLQWLVDSGAEIHVGSETMTEFRRSLTLGADRVVELTSRGVDYERLIETGMLRDDWVVALFQDRKKPTREQALERVDSLISQAESVLESVRYVVTHLDRGDPNNERGERTESIREFARNARGFAKPDEVATHDALLWEAVDGNEIADLVMTRDRTLRFIVKATGESVCAMFDDLIAAAFLGGADQAGLVKLFNHVIAMDLLPSGGLLSPEDIETIAGIEASLLSAPTRQLRRAAARVHQIKRSNLQSGRPVDDGEIAKAVLSVLASVKSDAVESARREAKLRLAQEVAEEQTRERENAEGELQRALRSKAESEEIAAERSRRHAAELDDLRKISIHQARELAELRATQEQRDMKYVRSQRLSDWNTVFVALAFVAVFLVWLGLNAAAGVCLAVCVVGCIIVRSVSETPVLKMATVLAFVGVLSGVATVVEKWDSIARLVAR